MEQYIVSARKYRPSTFATVVGQDALTATLKNAIATDHLAHAYLFCGSRGVGKTSCARIFAKTINCTNISPSGEACNECDSCRSFNQGNSMNIIEFDAASNNGVDDIKRIIEQVHIPPAQGRYRVFIIDEVHMLSNQAFNAFLKTLEEPPSYVIFILATTEKHKIIPTILSRCQIYDFSRITVADMVRHMRSVADREGIQAEDSALSVIARQADGAMRDALSIFDQVAASCRGNITYEPTIAALNVLDSDYYSRILDCLLSGDIPGALLIFNQIRAKGFDAQFFINGLGDFFRSVMLAGSEATRGLLDEPDEVKARLVAAASKVSPEFIYRAMNICNDADLNYRQSSNKQMLVELALIKIAQLLSPSPAESGQGEGLKPIARPTATQATAATTTQQAPPAAAPAPAVTPAASVPPRPAPGPPKPQSPAPQRPGTGLRVGAISMNGPREAAADQAPVHHGPRRGAAFTPEGVQAAWDAFISANLTEHALINLMRANRPAPQPDGTYKITLNNDLEASKISECFGHIQESLRNTLQNDDFRLTVGVEDKGLQPMFWNEQEVLRHMLENHSQFREFVEALKLTKI